MQGMSNERKRKRPSEGSDGPSTKRLDSPAVAANHASAIEPIGEGPSSVRFCMVGDFALLNDRAPRTPCAERSLRPSGAD